MYVYTAYQNTSTNATETTSNKNKQNNES